MQDPDCFVLDAKPVRASTKKPRRSSPIPLLTELLGLEAYAGRVGSHNSTSVALDVSLSPPGGFAQTT
jgi:hypothetical protein